MTDPTGAEAEAVVAAFIGAVERRDVVAAVALLADDVVYDNVPFGPVSGSDAVAAILGPMLEGCDEVLWPVLRQSATGEVVFNERLDKFHMAHGWVEVPVCGIWEVRAGKITLWRDYFDEPTYRNQLPSKTSSSKTSSSKKESIDG